MLSVRPVVASTQPPEHVSVSTGAVLIVFIVIVVAVAAHRDPKVATAIGAACAVGALLAVVMVV